MSIGYHCSHEQFSPGDLVRYAQSAERAGFEAIMSSDHFRPWARAQGHSGFVWSWLGAAMQATSLPFGTLCIPGGWRFHPALVAQASATLAEMFPGRLRWIAAGSGEALNESVTAQDWPDKETRTLRLEGAVEIMRALWRGEEVDREGPIPTRKARLYTLPGSPIDIVAPALTVETARRAGRWADGLITINAPRDKLRAIVDAFRGAGGAGKPIYLQVHLAWAADEREARLEAWREWRFNCVAPADAAELEMPEDFEAATRSLRPDEMDEHVRISSDLSRHGDWLDEDLAMGFAGLFLHQVGRDQEGFIDAFGREVLPGLKRGRG
jgi:coenzyme F420-dependent glucose-6-phosphate dehydrogenase